MGLLLLLALQDVEHTNDPLEAVRAALAEKKAVLVDVREKSEWDLAHLEAALWLPLSRLKEASAEDVGKVLPPDRVVYVYCAAGRRVLTAARLLKPLGYDVRPLKAGFEELRRAGFREASK